MLLQGDQSMIALMGGAAIVLLALAILACVIASLKTFHASQFQGLLSKAESQIDTLQHRLSNVLNAVPVALIETDKAGKFTFTNRSAQQLWGRTDDELIGLPFQSATWGIAYPDGSPIPADLMPIARALRGETVKGFQHLLTGHEQGEILVSVTSTPIINEMGDITGSTSAMVELETRAGEGVADLSGLWRGQWFSSAALPFWGLDEKAEIIDINPAALTLFDMTREQALGQNWTQFFVDDGDFQKAVDYLAGHDDNEPQNAASVSLRLKSQLYNITAWPMQTQKSSLHGLALLAMPTSEPAAAAVQPTAVHTLTETSPLSSGDITQDLVDYRLAEKARATLGIGTWRYDRETDSIIEDAGMMALIGRVEPGAPTLIPTSDQVIADEAFAKLMNEDTDQLALEIAVTHPDGATRWIAIEGRAIPDDDGVRHIYGVAFDRTAWNSDHELATTGPQNELKPEPQSRPEPQPEPTEDSRLANLQAELEAARAEHQRTLEALQNKQADMQAHADKMNHALGEARRYETVGRLTTDVVQDFTHMLNVINGALEVMAQQDDSPENIKRLAEAALNAGKRGERLTRQLQAFQSEDY